MADEMNADEFYEDLKKDREFEEMLNTTANKPEQYNIGIDTFERMRANATFEEAMGFIRWNIDKYNTRQKGQDMSDYKKIKAYCDEALWWLEKEGDSNVR